MKISEVTTHEAVQSLVESIASDNNMIKESILLIQKIRKGKR